MKKSLILVGMLSIGYAYAQEGKVGINTSEPKATIDIQPSTTNLTGTTNEGIIAPRLSKVRVANITEPKQGTLVYVLDENTTENPNALISAYVAGTNTAVDNRVAKITEKGYYFYNGTEWVKAGANGELWAQRDNNGVTETYLKPASANNDQYLYSEKNTIFNLGNITEEDTKDATDYKFLYPKETPHLLAVKSSKLPLNITVPYRWFSRNFFKVEEGNSTNVTDRRYIGKENWIKADNLTSDITYIVANDNKASFYSSSKTGGVVGQRIFTDVGSANYSPTVTTIAGLQAYPTVNSGKITEIYGITTSPLVNGGSITNLRGIQSNVESSRSSNGIYPTMDFTTIIGHMSNVTLRPNSTTKDMIGGSFISTVQRDTNVTGKYNGIENKNYFRKGSTVAEYNGILNHIEGEAEANVSNLYGFRLSTNLNNNFAPKKMYGLYLANIDKGTEENYAIYTNKGEVSIGGNVYIRNVDDVGLDTQKPAFMIGNQEATNLAMDNNEIMARNNGEASALYLQSDGGDVYINTSVSGQRSIFRQGMLGIGTYPTERLDVDGKIKATSLAQSGAGDRVVYADENGVLKTGISAAANVKLATGTNTKCEEATSGTMNFGSVTINGKATEAFGFCMKNSTGEYKWFYIYGGAGVTTGNGGEFGNGLQ